MNDLIEKYIQNFKMDPNKNLALGKFVQLGFPTKNLESWKYTNLAAALEPIFNLNPPENLEIKLPESNSRVVFINGKFSKENSQLPNGIELISKPRVNSNLETEDSLELLNLALSSQEIELKVSKNYQSDIPIEIIHSVTKSADGFILSPGLKIRVEVNSKVHILESFDGIDLTRYFTNSLTEIYLEDGSHVEYVKSVNESMNALHVGKVKAFCEKDSNFHAFTFTLGGKITRNNIEVALLKEGAETSAHGVYALSKEQHCDNFSLIDHRVAHTNSNQLYKGILDDESHGIFTGKIKVQPDAQKTNSQQLTKNLLLSKKAHANARPILEIYADDVKCSHGAAVGKMDPDEVFYLETRGIPKIKAQRMLCNAFALEGINYIESPAIKNKITDLLLEKLKKFDVGHFNEEV